jgi:hypothetical protein
MNEWPKPMDYDKMSNDRIKRPMTRTSGFTFVEMMISILVSTVAILSVMGLLANSHLAFNRMYRRVYGEIVTDAEIARIVFDKTVRKSTIRYCDIDETGQYVEVYYYSGTGSAELDRYARFYFSGENLIVRRGSLEPGTFDYATGDTPSILVLARNVTSGLFVQSGITLRMYMILDNDEDSISVTCSSTRHNI